jgi:hypothetical protein
MLARDSLPQAVQQAIGRVNGLPIPGILVDLVYMDEFDTKRSGLLTVNLNKGPIDGVIFATPKNCQKVKDENDVYEDAARDQDVGDLFKSK